MPNPKILLTIVGITLTITACLDDSAEEFIDFSAPNFEVYAYENADTLQVLGVQESAVYVEDFTGNNCSNCPDAAKRVKAIEEKYPGRIVTVAIHSGTDGFVAPKKGYSKYDFRSKDGNSIAAMLGASGNLPEGAIDRLVHGEETGVISQRRTLWESYADSRIDKKTPLGVYIEEIELTEDTLVVQVMVAYHQDVSEGSSHYISTYLTENGIIDNQYDIIEGDIKDYEHNHVFRTALGTFSGDLMEGSYPRGKIYKWTYRTGIKKDKEGELYKTGWNSEKLDVVVLVHEKNNDDFKVIQAAKKHLGK